MSKPWKVDPDTRAVVRETTIGTEVICQADSVVGANLIRDALNAYGTIHIPYKYAFDNGNGVPLYYHKDESPEGLHGTPEQRAATVDKLDEILDDEDDDES